MSEVPWVSPLAVGTPGLRSRRCRQATVSVTHGDEELLGLPYQPRDREGQGVTPSMSVYRDEIFGPVLSVVPVNSFDEALALVNANPRQVRVWMGVARW